VGDSLGLSLKKEVCNSFCYMGIWYYNYTDFGNHWDTFLVYACSYGLSRSGRDCHRSWKGSKKPGPNRVKDLG